MAAREELAVRIRALNDRMRMEGPVTDKSSHWHLTTGVSQLGTDTVRECVRLVTEFSDFDADNDPHGEHDFGSFELGDDAFFWKIDYYDPSLTSGSSDPANPDATCRVLTIMLASEY